jgi:hypothetical protein
MSDSLKCHESFKCEKNRSFGHKSDGVGIPGQIFLPHIIIIMWGRDVYSGDLAYSLANMIRHVTFRLISSITRNQLSFSFHQV